MIELGCTAKDRITGFCGVVVGRVQYLTGCNQALVSPPVGADGRLVDSAWIDEQRLVPDETVSIIEFDNSGGAGFDLAPPIR